MSKRPTTLSTDAQVELGSRIARIVDVVGGPREAARTAGVTVKQLSRWMAGVASPNAVSLGKLVDRTTFALDWVVSGEGPEQRGERAKDSLTLPGKVTAHAEAWAGGPAALKVVTMLEHAGLFAVYADEGFPLEERDEDDVLAIAREIAKALTNHPPERWPQLVKLAVDVQRAALRHASRIYAERRTKKSR